MTRVVRASTAMKKTSRHDLEVKDLLIPIVEFLHRSGFTQSDLLAECRSAIQHSTRAKKGVKVVHIGYDQLGLTLVSRWLRDPEFLNHAGRPADLPIRGKRSFSTLLKSCAIDRPATCVIKSLVRFGTVKQISPTQYRLVQRSVNFAVPNYIPFEPNFQFLVDATRASTWGSGITPKAPRLFWQNVASNDVPQKYAAEFLRFAKDRGLTFMHEINDWLEAHEAVSGASSIGRQRDNKTHRLGIGLFGVCSNK